MMHYRDLILGMVSKSKRDAIYMYKDFVDMAIGGELEDPLKNVYGGMILGGTRFIKEALNRIEEENLDKKDISHRRALRAAYGFEEIMDSICIYFDISMDEIVRNKNKRDIAIYLLKKHTCLTNRQIGEQFGNISYSAVAKAYWRFSERLKKDKMLRKKIAEIMSYVKG